MNVYFVIDVESRYTEEKLPAHNLLLTSTAFEKVKRDTHCLLAYEIITAAVEQLQSEMLDSEWKEPWVHIVHKDFVERSFSLLPKSKVAKSLKWLEENGLIVSRKTTSGKANSRDFKLVEGNSVGFSQGEIEEEGPIF